MTRTNLADQMCQTAEELREVGDEPGAFMLEEIRADWISGKVPYQNACIALGSARRRIERAAE